MIKFGWLLVLLLIAVATDNAHAQGGAGTMADGGGECDRCDWYPGGDRHSFWNFYACTSGVQCYDCDAFNACHGFWQDGTCDKWHFSCGLAAADFERIRLLGSGEGRITRDLLEDLDESHSIVLNESRGVYQLVDCQGNVAIQYRATPVIAQALRLRALFASRAPAIGPEADEEEPRT